ncbi:MAG: SIMPL domain-containing protein [Gammaproteobacteria bacterium]|nr:SIMPL domain-containing protein [Gammaproteobacteria bacterium]
MHKSTFACVLFLSALGLIAAPVALGAEQCNPRQVSVTTSGFAKAAPGLYVFHVGISHRGTDVSAANDAVARSAAAAVAAALDAGVAKEDIRSTEISITPVYNADRKPAEPQIFEVTRDISIVLRDPSHYAELAEGLIDAGVNHITRIEARPSDPRALADQALAEAVANAVHKARLIAHKLGVKLGPALRISESGGVHPVPRVMAMSADSAKSGYLHGQIKTEAQVSATFALSPSGCPPGS